MTYATYGLPRYVIAILHIMEAHKDCLKWTVSERSHKLSLTLTWDFKFRDGKVKKTFWEKLQKTLKGGNNSSSSTNAGVSGTSKSSGVGSKTNVDELTSEIPRNLIRFIKHLEMETKEEERGLQMARQSLQRASQQRLNNIGNNNSGSNKANQQSVALKRQQRWSRYSLQSLPVRYQSNSQTQLARLNDANMNVASHQQSAGTVGSSQKQSSGYKQGNQNQRYNVMKSFASYHQLPTRDILSPYHGEWPDGSFEASSDPVDDGCGPSEHIIASGGPAAARPKSGGHRSTTNQVTNINWTSGRGLKTIGGIGPEQNDVIGSKSVRQVPETSSASCRGDDLDDDSEFNESSLHAGPSGVRKSEKRHSSVMNHKATSVSVSGNATKKQPHPSRIASNSEHRRSTSVGGGSSGARGLPSSRRRELNSIPLSVNNLIATKSKEALTSVASHCSLAPQSNSTAAVTSDSDSASELQSDEEDSDRKQTVNQTVIRCLDSCDKILFRHSTTIT